MNVCNVKKTFSDYKSKGWDRIFVLVDAHGTIIPSGTHDEFHFINEDAKEVLKWFSDRPEVRLILWTSSYPAEAEQLTRWLLSNGIHVWYINENPEAKNTERAYFEKKPYYNICIDDRAGFTPETDWDLIKRELQLIGEWNK
jgi:hypothetical protein